jgi:hypothetical protein
MSATKQVRLMFRGGAEHHRPCHATVIITADYGGGAVRVTDRVPCRSSVQFTLKLLGS